MKKIENEKMFTGIITDIGKLQAIDTLPHGKRFRITSKYESADIDIGASIAHDGVCLTVVAKSNGNDSNWYDVEAWEEALRLTTLGSWRAGQKINLERALKMGDELGGHLVSGHVDGMAEVLSITPQGEASRFLLSVPHELAKFIAPKGSVTLDGTSLTVNTVAGETFDVLIIKHTLEVTKWGEVKTGQQMNLEVDQMARYAARLGQFNQSS